MGCPVTSWWPASRSSWTPSKDYSLNPLSLNLSADALAWIVEDPFVERLLATFDIHEVKDIKLSDTGISARLSAQGKRVKVKVGLRATHGRLLLDIRDVKATDLLGLSLGGGWLEKHLPLERFDGSLVLPCPYHCKAAGISASMLTIIFD